MNSEKVKEIKKALEDNTTDHLPYIDGHKCKMMPYVDILTYINELESVNKWLLCKAKEKNNEIDNYTEENEQLKDRIAELEKENDEKHKRIMELEQDLIHADENVFYRECNVALREDKIKAEALKHFADMLKKQMSEGEFWGQKYKLAVFRDIDIDDALNNFLKGDDKNNG